MVNRSILSLLQFTALILPAIAIYLDFAYGDVNLIELEEDDEEVLEGEIHRGRLSVLFLVLGGAILLLQILIGVPSTSEGLIGANSCSPTLIFGICSSTILSVSSILFLLLGLGMFGFLVAFGREARKTDTNLIWGAVDMINQSNPYASSREDRCFDPDEIGTFSLASIIFLILASIIVALVVVSPVTQIGIITIVLVAGMSSFVTAVIMAVCYEVRT